MTVAAVPNRMVPAGSRRSIVVTSSPIPPASDRNSPSLGIRAALTKCVDHAPVTRFGLDKSREQRTDRQRFDIARVDAADERLSDQIDCRLAEPPPEERRHRFVVAGVAALHGRLEGEPRSSRRRQQIEASQPRPRRGDSENGRRGQWKQIPVLEDERRARRVGRDHPPAKTELVAQLYRSRFLNQHRIGSGVDREPADLLGQDQPAGAVRRFQHDEGHTTLRQLVRGRQSGDACADDDDHVISNSWLRAVVRRSLLVARTRTAHVALRATTLRRCSGSA